MSPSETQKPPLSVLVVDDVAINRVLAIAFLSRMGYKTLFPGYFRGLRSAWDACTRGAVGVGLFVQRKVGAAELCGDVPTSSLKHGHCLCLLAFVIAKGRE